MSGDADSITSGDLGEKAFNGHRSRKVPKVFSKEAITKLRAWLFANLSVNLIRIVVLSFVYCKRKPNTLL